MGWMGDIHQVKYVLGIMGADQDEDGRFIVRGEISSFMGIGPECVVSDNVEYFVNGKPCNLAAAMSGTSYGIKAVVI